jgi:hypothetical protein
MLILSLSPICVHLRSSAFKIFILCLNNNLNAKHSMTVRK